MEIDPEKPCGELSVAEQQVVEIAKALSQNARIIVMDEPTAALTPREVEGLLRVVRELRSQGIGIIYISHRLDEIDAIADRVTILRDEFTRRDPREVGTGSRANDRPYGRPQFGKGVPVPGKRCR